MENKPEVVITGIGIRSPLGNDVDTFFNSLLNKVTHFPLIDFLNLNVEKRASFFAYRSEYREPSGSLPYNNLPHKLLIDATDEALENGKIESNDAKANTIVLIGTTSGGARNREVLQDNYIDGGQGFSDITNRFQSLYSVSEYVAKTFDLKSGSRTINTACSSGVNALGYGKMMIQNKVVSRVIVGGVNTIDYASLLGFSSIGINPKDIIRPFDKFRDGFYLGEGAAILILEDLAHAIDRKAPILSKISGFYSSSNGSGHLTNPDENGYLECMRGVLNDSGLPCESINYINAHGTATPANDTIEAKAIKKCFKNYRNLNISSTKSSTGHTLGAAGAIESLICVKAISEGIIPPNKNLTHLDDACKGMSFPLEPQKIDLKNALCNSFGFGGNNTSIILSKFED